MHQDDALGTSSAGFAGQPARDLIKVQIPKGDDEGQEIQLVRPIAAIGLDLAPGPDVDAGPIAVRQGGAAGGSWVSGGHAGYRAPGLCQILTVVPGKRPSRLYGAPRLPLADVGRWQEFRGPPALEKPKRDHSGDGAEKGKQETCNKEG
jgi:hypothetical protein